MGGAPGERGRAPSARASQKPSPPMRTASETALSASFAAARELL